MTAESKRILANGLYWGGLACMVCGIGGVPYVIQTIDKAKKANKQPTNDITVTDGFSCAKGIHQKWKDSPYEKHMGATYTNKKDLWIKSDSADSIWRDGHKYGLTINGKEWYTF